MNPDLELIDETDCYLLGGCVWLAQVDQWGRECAVCERCGDVMGIWT